MRNAIALRLLGLEWASGVVAGFDADRGDFAAGVDFK
jgi:hypothetical protein